MAAMPVPGAQHSPAPRSGGHLPDEKEATVLLNVPLPGKGDTTTPPTLQVIAGSANKKTFVLGKEKLTIGRAKYNDLVLNDSKVSRSHAEVYFEKGQCVIQDLNSTNGVFVDGEQITKLVLKPRNQINIGDAVLVFIQSELELSMSDKMAFIQRSDLFNWLDEETKTLLAEHLRIRFFPKGTTVLRQNAPVDSMFFLYSGGIRVVDLNEEGGERTVGQINPGDSFGESALLAGEPVKFSLVANLDIHVLELRRDRLNTLLQKKPELHKAFYRMVIKRQSETQTKTDVETHIGEELRTLIKPTDVQIIGEDKKIREAKKKIEALAKENKTALIVGPAGVGKKAFARFFHKQSSHPESPYVELSLPELENDKVGPAIFGVEADPEAAHMKGQMGYLEVIGSGTLAITHAEQLDAHQQSKLATYLKHGWFHRVYGREVVKTKTNVILLGTGTESEVLEKFIPELRELLKERIVSLPPLIQRLKDIPLLAEYYIARYAKKNGKHIRELSREAREKLITYKWPGNVKELKNVIQRAAIVTSEEVIIPGDLIFVVPSEKEIHRINILRNDQFWKFFRHPLVPKIFVWFNIFMVVVMAGFTLFGGSRPADHPLQEFGNNPGMLITWLVWFPLLPISALLLGRIWCSVCPIAGIGDIISRVKRFNLPVPKILKRMDFWAVAISFMFLDFMEEFLGVADKPWATGMLLVTIISISVLFCLLFERKTFCRYVCPLAGMLGTYSTASIVEVRGNKKVCQTQCNQHFCYKGTEHADGCPMFSYPASLSSNTECMMCLNCVKNCENRGVQLNLRPPLQELWHQAQPMFSLSLFGVIMVGLMARHQFPKTGYCLTLEQSLNWPAMVTHTVLFLSFIGISVIPFFFASSISAAASQEKITENMTHYGMAFIPLAIAGHLSHVMHEFLGEGIYELLAYPVKLYYFLLSGIPIGSREVVVNHFIHTSLVSFLKFMTVSGGMLAALIALIMIARRYSALNVLGRVMPHVMLLLLFYAGYLFIFLSSTDSPASEGAPAAQIEPSQTTAPSGRTTDSGTAPAPAATSQPAAGATVQSPPAPAGQAVSFSLTLPNLKGAAWARLSDASASQWLQSARIIPTTGGYRLPVQGVVTGAPQGALVYVSLDTGATNTEFSSPLDAGGNFRGEINLVSITQRIPLVFQLVDPRSNTVVSTYRVVLF
jgi:transcriptional regulator with AAA-type ATPase domain/polyferredoxin